MRRESGKVESVVPCLCRIVEDTAVGLTNDFFQFHTLIDRPGYEFVQVVHVCLQVFPVVEVQSFCTDDRCQRFRSIRQLGHEMFHSLKQFGVKEWFLLGSQGYMRKFAQS